ncbi:MAG: hypothetical protein WBA62_03800 [Xanthobacteraceae bacterium]
MKEILRSAATTEPIIEPPYDNFTGAVRSMTNDLDPVKSITASHLVTSALVASLIPTLVEHDVLSAQDARLRHALLLIEMKQDDDLRCRASMKPRGN